MDIEDSIAKEKKWGEKMSGNFAIKGGGVGRLMANAILNFHFDFLNTSLRGIERKMPVSQLGTESKNQNGNLRWHLPLGVRPPPP